MDNNEVTLPDGTLIPSTHFDPDYKVRQIAPELGLYGPPSKIDIARYMFGQNKNTRLCFTPGTQDFDTTGGSSYSNFGYLLLGLVIERAAAQPYIDFVRDRVLAPRGISDVFLARMLAGSLNPREVTYEDPGATGPNALEPHASIDAPRAYGGGGFVTELMDSSGGLMATAEAVVRFVANHAIWGLGERSPGKYRIGELEGTGSLAASLATGYDIVFIFNRNPGRKAIEALYSELI